MNSKRESQKLLHGWKVYQTDAGAIDSPDKLDISALQGLPATLPSSLFHTLQENQQLVDDAEQYDWWYCCDFSVSPEELYSNSEISFDRMATLVDVWLNGTLLLSHSNFFLLSVADVSKLITERNQLVLCFRSVNEFLAKRRSRPKWKTNLVSQQQLRWLRTSLLGRIPGWTPPTPALGPCGDITLTHWSDFNLLSANVRATIEDGCGTITAEVMIAGTVQSVCVQFGEHELELQTNAVVANDMLLYESTMTISDPKLWWPHTHGESHLYAVSLKVSSESSETIIPLGRRGFRTIAMDANCQQTQLRVNGQTVFCRGACWTIADLTRFWSEEDVLRSLLTLARDAGMNMLRVGGTMHYEQDEFYNLCDELGIMVWQDFMFANMDYPVDDSDFLSTVTTEARYQLSRFSQHASVAIYCGSSEVQQQAAMVGMERGVWSNTFFDQILPNLCQKNHPGIHYYPSTPCGGAMPFHLAEGITHFYGVGAYKKTLLASGLTDVRFTAETLGFSNVPDAIHIEKQFNGNYPVCHSPTWKKGVPRDSTAGWDFEDIRDHYLAELFQLDPVLLRSRDTERYLELSRVVTGELIKQVFAYWRSLDTPCQGGLLWFYNDITMGAGWGLVDSQARPKPVYYYAKRAFQPCAAFLLDKGLDGLKVLVVNESKHARKANVEIQLISTPHTIIDRTVIEVEISPFSEWQAHVDSLFGHFRDLNYSYQFGAKQHELVCLQVVDTTSGHLLGEDTYYVETMQLPELSSVELELKLSSVAGEDFLILKSDHFLQSVCLELGKCRADDNYFNLLPGVARRVKLSSEEVSFDLVKGYLSAINLTHPIRIRIRREDIDAE